MNTITVKCLTEQEKKAIAYYYHSKKMNLKALAHNYEVSPRTINRVLVEYGLATPVARIKGEAYQVMQLLKKHGHDLKSLQILLEGANAQQAAA